MFNVINTLLFIGFTTWFARLAEKLVPERAAPEGVIIEPEFLDEAALKAPSIALQQVRLELGRVGEITLGMLKAFGFSEYSIALSTKPEKAVGSDEIWDKSEAALRAAIESARGMDLSYLPKRPSKQIGESFDKAAATFEGVLDRREVASRLGGSKVSPPP